MANSIRYLAWSVVTEIAGNRHTIHWSVENNRLVIEGVDAEMVDKYLTILNQGAESLTKLEDTVKGLEAALSRHGQVAPAPPVVEEVEEPEMPSVGALSDPEALIMKGAEEMAPLFTDDVRATLAEKALEIEEAEKSVKRPGMDPAAVLEYYKKTAATKVEPVPTPDPVPDPTPSPLPKDDLHIDFPDDILSNRSVTEVVMWLRDQGHASTEDTLVKILMANGDRLTAFRATEATEFAFRKRIRHALDFLNGAL